MSRFVWTAALCLSAAGCSEADVGPPPLPDAPSPARDASAPERLPSGWFTDVTADSGLEFTLTSGDAIARQIVEVKGGGLALLDYDGDGDWDVFAPNGATLEQPGAGPGSALFRNRGGLAFEDVTEDAHARYRRWAMGATAGDLDGDGWTDLFLPTFGPDGVLWNGGGSFESDPDTGLSHPGWSMGTALGDLDLDGDLDLYVPRFIEFDAGAPPPATRFLGVEVFAGPAGLPAAADSLYLNEGERHFRDASVEAGVHGVEPAYGLGALILDLDEDGHQDVFVGNDSGRNFLFAGRTGRAGLGFEELGLVSGIGFNSDGRGQATMGIAVADVSGNGLADIYTTNFAEDTNTLQVNRGGMRFDDRTQAYGLGLASQPYLGWAAAFRDFDLDGAEDLFVFNGHVYPPAVTTQLGVTTPQRPLLYRREGRAFRLLGPDLGGAPLAALHTDRGAAFGDLDGDGDVDVVVLERGGPLRLLRNDAPPAGAHWLAVVLEDARPESRNRAGLGAALQLTQGETSARRWQVSGTSYLSTNARESYFGLPGAGPATIEVHWPDGELQRVELEGTDRRVVVRRD